MLLQITQTDTLDRINNISGESSIFQLILVVSILLVGIFTYILFKKKHQKNIEEKKESQTPITKQITLEIKKTENTQIKNALIVQKENRKDTIEQLKETLNTDEHITPKLNEKLKPDKEEHSKEKYIGYNPINIFAQTEPLNFPYVLMPKHNSVIKFPRKGRNGRRGYKEEEFLQYIEKYFKCDYQIFDDRFILVKNNPKPFEPDFTLINENNGINIFLDIEIDEPYEGLNDIAKRKPTHYQQSDINRNNAFKNRGWIVIRFAEIQIHQEPNSCCRFIADVLKSINPKYSIPEQLLKFDKVKLVRQWTEEEAMVWSKEKYREKYLGIERFGLATVVEEPIGIEETALGDKIEEQVEDEVFVPIKTKSKTSNVKLEKIYSAINSNKYLSLTIDNEKTIIKPHLISEEELIGFCYVKNRKRNFSLYKITNIEIKDSYYTLRVAGPSIGLDQISNAVNTAITYHKFIRMKYTRSSWTNMVVDEETGELLINQIEAEESIRTINNVQLSINVLTQEHIETYNLNNNYITAYCNKREEQRTFRFDRIGEIEILNI